MTPPKYRKKIPELLSTPPKNIKKGLVPPKNSEYGLHPPKIEGPPPLSMFLTPSLDYLRWEATFEERLLWMKDVLL